MSGMHCRVSSPPALHFLDYFNKTQATCKLHPRGDKNRVQPPAVANGSKISTGTPRRLNTFIPAAALMATPGQSCPIYCFNLPLKVREVRFTPVLDKPQMHPYDHMCQIWFRTQKDEFVPSHVHAHFRDIGLRKGLLI